MKAIERVLEKGLPYPWKCLVFLISVIIFVQLTLYGVWLKNFIPVSDVYLALCGESFQVKLASLSLDYHARDKLLRLVGDRYNPDTDVLTLTTDT